MRILLTILLVATTVATASAQQAIHKPFIAPMTADKIQVAIDDGVHFLRSQIRDDGRVADDSYNGGATALSALALLAAGGNPIADDQLDTMLEWLASHEYNNTYYHGVRANVWEYALRKAPHETKYRDRLKADYDWLMKATKDKRAWRYNQGSTDWDNSCTQYGVLGIWAAQRAGFEPGAKFWSKISDHFMKCQTADGGWGYTSGSPSATMATAGLASMFLVYDSHQGRTAWTGDVKTADTEAAAKIRASIEKGMKWLGEFKGSKTEGYYLYGIERTGVASGLRRIGGEDWFADGALNILKAQRGDGSIPLSQWGGGSISTSFCTLFLVYGGAPVAIQKLQYGEDDNWNRNSRDLANLSKELWSLYEKPVNWQIVSIEADADELDAPILFISGSDPMKLSEEEMVKLRNYILAGGTILAEPSNQRKEFADSIRVLFREMFPESEYPDYALKPLADDHPIFTVMKQEWKHRPKLLGAGNGSRTFFILSQDYHSAEWQTANVKSDSFKLASNLLFYVTDLGDLQSRFVSILPHGEAAKKKEKNLNVAIARFGESGPHPRDWESASTAWKTLAKSVEFRTGAEVNELPAVRLHNDDLSDVQLLHLAGRYELELTKKEKDALAQFVKNGGTIIVDAVAGSPEFAASSRELLTELFGDLNALKATHPLATGRFVGGDDLTADMRFTLPARQQLRKQGKSSKTNQLEVAMVDERPAVIFSQYDLASAATDIRNYRAVAYKPESARKILVNIAAFVLLD